MSGHDAVEVLALERLQSVDRASSSTCEDKGNLGPCYCYNFRKARDRFCIVAN